MSNRLRIAVIGGSGFIGTRLVAKLLALGHQVVIGDIRESDAYPDYRRFCDVTRASTLPLVLEGCDTVYNLAAEHRDDVRPISRYYKVNCDGTRNLCESMSTLGIPRLIFASTVAIYGFTGSESVTENQGPAPFNDYGRSKAEAEDVVKGWQVAGDGRMAGILRPTVVFGPGNRGNVYNLLSLQASGRFLMIGPGTNRKSMAYVENVAAALEWMLELQSGQHIFNYVDEPDMTMAELVALTSEVLGKSPRFKIPKALGLAGGALCDLIAGITNASLPVSRVRVEKFCMDTRFSAHKIRSAGFRPDTSLRDALRRTMSVEFAETGGSSMAGH